MAINEKLSEKAKEVWGGFVATLGKTSEEVAAALAGTVGDINDNAIALLGDAGVTPDADIKAALAGLSIPTAIVNSAIKGIRSAPVVSATPAEPTVRSSSLLIQVGNDASILEVLRIGGVAKMSDADAVAAIRGAFTRSVGVDRIIPTLLAEMERHAESLDESLGTIYYKVLRTSRRRQYADVLSAFDGAIVSVPEEDKRKFLDKVDTLWPVLAAIQDRLDAYRQQHRDEAGDLGNIVQAIRGGAAGVEYPDTTPVITAARGVVDRFNRVFGGKGIPTARTIAKDMAEESEQLRNPELPGTIGAGSFEEMVKKLGLSVPSDVRQTEVNIATYVLNLLKLPDQPSSQQPLIILELQRLGKAIPWGTIATSQRSSPHATALSEVDPVDGAKMERATAVEPDPVTLPCRARCARLFSSLLQNGSEGRSRRFWR